MISSKLVQFLKIEARDSIVEKGTKEFERAIREIKAKLNEGKEVLTIVGGKPVLISRQEPDNPNSDINITPVNISRWSWRKMKWKI